MEKVFDVIPDDENEFLFSLKVSGKLRRGTQLNGVEWKQALSQARSVYTKKKIIFDLTDLTYWDTGGMGDVIGTVVHINKMAKGPNKRAAIVSPSIPHLLKLIDVLKFARRKFPKYEISEGDIPILSDQSKVQAFVDG